jgi:hypothetical protein
VPGFDENQAGLERAFAQADAVGVSRAAIQHALDRTGARCRELHRASTRPALEALVARLE